MKKVIFILILMASNVYSIGNNPVRNKLGIGVRAGIGYNFIDISPVPNNVSTSNIFTFLNFGVLTEYRISQKFSIQSELYYQNRGFKVSDINSTQKVKIEMTGISMLPKLRFGNADDTKALALFGGPSLLYTNNMSLYDYTYNISADYDSKYYKSFSWSAILGAGYSQKIGNFECFSDIRMNYSISKIFEDNTNTNVYPHQISWNLGVLYYLK